MSNRLKLIRERANRRQRVVPIITDGRVLERIEAVEQELDRLDAEPPSDQRLGSKSPRHKLSTELDRLWETAAETTLWLALEGMQRSVYLALVRQHPPRTGEDGKILPADALGVNGDTFGVPLIRACIAGYRDTEDGETLPIDQETVDWLLGTDDAPGFATDKQIETLFGTAFLLNRGDDAAPLRRRHSPTRLSADE